MCLLSENSFFMVSLKKKKNLLLKFKMDLVVVTGRCQTDSRGCRALPLRRRAKTQGLQAAPSPWGPVRRQAGGVRRRPPSARNRARKRWFWVRN